MQEILDFLKKFVGDNKTVSTEDAAQVATYLKSNAGLQPLYQSVYDTGHADATGRLKAREKTLADELKAEKDRADKATSDLEDFKKDTPDVVKLEERYKADNEKLQTEIKTLKTQFKDRELAWYKQSATDKLVSALTKAGIDPEWAEYLANKPEMQSRIKVNINEGVASTEILREGSETLMIQSDKPTEAFAAEIRKGVPAKFIVSQVTDLGPNDREGGGGGGKTKWDGYREEQKQHDKEAKPEGFKSGAERLGIT